MQITSRFTIAIHILACVDYFHGRLPVNSGILSESTGANPVIVRGIMSSLHKAGLIRAGRGRNDITLQKPLEEISFYDVYRAVDDSRERGLFRFHENPNPACPVGRNIHRALDEELDQVQCAMEEEMKRIPVVSVTERIRRENQKLSGIFGNSSGIND